MNATTRAVYPHVVAAVFNRPWAIHPDTMAIITAVVSGRVEGYRLTPEDIEARLLEASTTHGPRSGGGMERNIAVLPMYGVISPRAGMLANASGGTSVEGLRRQFRAAMADPKVHGIVFDIDSPGGAVDGIPEFADEVAAARGTKPIHAVANTAAYSAAYWLGTQADRLWVTPSGSVGSIGVIAAHEDHSKRLESEGIKPTFITSSPYKAEGNSAEPLSDEARESIQHDVDLFHAMFVRAVAAGRDVDVDTVEQDYGQGRVVNAAEAVERGMADGLKTLESAVAATAAAEPGAPAIAAARSAVVSKGSFGTPPVAESFAERLARVTAEAEAVTAHALERRAMRQDEGRDLSATTREQLHALLTSLERLVAEEPAKEQPAVAAKVQALDAILMTYHMEG